MSSKDTSDDYSGAGGAKKNLLHTSSELAQCLSPPDQYDEVAARTRGFRAQDCRRQRDGDPEGEERGVAAAPFCFDIARNATCAPTNPRNP